MTLQDRIDSYAAQFPGRPPMHVVREGAGKERHDVLYGQMSEDTFDDGLQFDEIRGIWVIGNDYRNKTKYYGAYPAGYLARVMALFPDVQPIVDGRMTTLHAFSGSLPEGPYVRCDTVQPAELSCRVEDLEREVAGWYDLCFADPPYSAEDAVNYGTPMVHRGKAMRGLARVVRSGGHVVWLDTTWPMHRKDEWTTVGRITLVRSTNHRVRMVSLFQRTSPVPAA